MTQIDDFIRRCEEAASGSMERDEQKELYMALYTAYRMTKELWEVCKRAEAFQWRAAADALRAYRDKLDHELAMAQAAAGIVSVNANASSTASAHASAYVDAVAGLETIESLDDEDRAELEKLMLDVKSAKDKTLLGVAAEKLVEVAVEKGVETLPWVLPVIVEAVAKLTGAV